MNLFKTLDHNEKEIIQQQMKMQINNNIDGRRDFTIRIHFRRDKLKILFLITQFQNFWIGGRSVFVLCYIHFFIVDRPNLMCHVLYQKY